MNQQGIPNKLPKSVVFMKVGNHAGETFEQILERKNSEFAKAGKIFWGYGGTACHPIQQVQPFARLTVKEEGSVYLVMQYVELQSRPRHRASQRIFR